MSFSNEVSRPVVLNSVILLSIVAPMPATAANRPSAINSARSLGNPLSAWAAWWYARTRNAFSPRTSSKVPISLRTRAIRAVSIAV